MFFFDFLAFFLDNNELPGLDQGVNNDRLILVADFPAKDLVLWQGEDADATGLILGDGIAPEGLMLGDGVAPEGLMLGDGRCP